MSEVIEQLVPEVKSVEVHLDEPTRLMLREKCKTDLYFFAKAVLGFDKLSQKIHLPICQLLEDYHKNTRLRIVLPRSWFKSTIGSIAYPVWRAINDPNVRICIVQNSHTNACKKLSVIRGLFESCVLFRALFPELLPNKHCTWTSESLCIPRSKDNPESTFEAAGTRTKSTSRHYNVIIEDDTVAPDLDDLSNNVLLPSQEDVEQAIGWHRLAIPLLVDPMSDQLIIIGTRWFERDLISYNTQEEPHYVGYIRSVKESSFGVSDEEGELVWPERFDETVLAELERSLGPYMFSCLFYNKPVRSKDMVFQPNWFVFFDTEPRDLLCYTSVDLASDPIECKGDPDYNVVLTCGKDMRHGKGDIYVLDYFRKRCGPSEVIDAVLDHVIRFSPVKVGIESVQYQKVMMYYIKEAMRARNKYFTVEQITHGKRSKNSRIQGLQPLFKASLIHMKTWMRQLQSELTAFPLAPYDDVSDCLSMQIPMWAITDLLLKKTVKINPQYDMSLESAIAELTEKYRKDQLNKHSYGRPSREYDDNKPSIKVTYGRSSNRGRLPSYDE